MSDKIELPTPTKKLVFKVVGRYEDESEDVFEEFDSYTAAEQFIWATKYVAEEFYIKKVWVQIKR